MGETLSRCLLGSYATHHSIALKWGRNPAAIPDSGYKTPRLGWLYLDTLSYTWVWCYRTALVCCKRVKGVFLLKLSENLPLLGQVPMLQRTALLRRGKTLRYNIYQNCSFRPTLLHQTVILHWPGKDRLSQASPLSQKHPNTCHSTYRWGSLSMGWAPADVTQQKGQTHDGGPHPDQGDKMSTLICKRHSHNFLAD